VVEAQSVDVVFRRPRTCAVGLAQCVQLLAEGVETADGGYPEVAEQGGARDGDWRFLYEHLWGGLCLLVSLVRLVLLFLLLLLVSRLPVVGLHGFLPQVNDVLAGAFARSHVADEYRHEDHGVKPSVAIACAHSVGVCPKEGEQRHERLHFLLAGLAVEASLEGLGKVNLVETVLLPETFVE